MLPRSSRRASAENGIWPSCRPGWPSTLLLQVIRPPLFKHVGFLRSTALPTKSDVPHIVALPEAEGYA